jgi:four helix bundle protein
MADGHAIPRVFRFERLEVWRRAVELAPLVYQATAGFPESERYSLVSQIRRATVSISANIAEGSGRSTERDFARFLDQAYGSAMEVVSEVEIAARLGYIDAEMRSALRQELFEIAAMLTGLKKRILAP